VANQSIFAYINRISPNGGNDYWESGPCRPDLVLSDMVAIFSGKHGTVPLNFYKRLTDTTDLGGIKLLH
jgi:hypothetical protein